MKNKVGQKQDITGGESETKEGQAAAAGRPFMLPSTCFDPKRILVPIDFSPGSLRALSFSQALAARFQAKVTLLHVVERATFGESYLSLPLGPDEANQSQLESCRERLNELVEDKAAPFPAAESLVRIGRAHAEILDTAKALGADLIVIATHGQGAAQQGSLGSTTARIVAQGTCPVLTIH